jgi:hypothetical protein
MPDYAGSEAAAKLIEEALAERFGEALPVDPGLAGLDELSRIASHRVHRRFVPRELSPELVRLLCACALSAPSKSDLQQADILVVRDRDKHRAITALIPDMPWIAQAPLFLVFLADASRLLAISRLRNKPFPNDHLDLLFNAVADSAIVLATFMRAAAAVGLGCCPISAIRDSASVVSCRRGSFPSPGCAWAGRPSRGTSRRGSGSMPRCTRIATAVAISRRRSTPMIDGAKRVARIGASAHRSGGARPRLTAGPRTRRGNTPSRCAPTSAPSSAPKAFGWNKRFRLD